MAYNLNYDDIYNKELAKTAQQKANDVAKINSMYDSQKSVTTDEYNRDVEQTKRSYADDYQKNAVQKLINERQIAENMANLGLTDSGLNRTQQTAVQLSYANQRGKIDVAKQQALDQKSSALTAAIASIEQGRISALDQNEKYWSGVAADNAQSIYKANVDAYTKEQEALIAANAKLQEAMINAASSNYNQLYRADVVDKLAGTVKFSYQDAKGNIKYRTVQLGVNPYTNTNNIALGNNNKSWDEVKTHPTASDAQKAVALYGAYNNGYQPKGVVYDGKHYGEMKGVADTVTTKSGNTQNVWKTKGKSGITRWWIWDGSNNTYIPVQQNDQGKWVETEV